ncbi:uncharacterized protein LOC116179248 isoform X2 [Photinus pyralis]|nr:uncharacterized protein LOC116164717 isoform X2 [Photinus pyralis]XP_031354850.1 uncharacterized protein LOC116179248 isoform X2 [Photinus pyralis]
MKNGLPEIDAPPLDPLQISSAAVEKGGLHIHFFDIHVYNITDSLVHHVNATITSSRIHMTMLASAEEILTTMDYNIKGSLLVFTLNGGDKAVIRFKNVTFDLELDGDVVEKNGEQRFRINTFTAKLDPALVTYDMQDIFQGQKELTDVFNRALNENWHVFFYETQPEFEEILSQFLVQYANNVFKYVPIEKPN